MMDNETINLLRETICLLDTADGYIREGKAGSNYLKSCETLSNRISQVVQDHTKAAAELKNILG